MPRIGAGGLYNVRRTKMGNVVFFSYFETDRETVLMIKGRALNPNQNSRTERRLEALPAAGER